MEKRKTGIGRMPTMKEAEEAARRSIEEDWRYPKHYLYNESVEMRWLKRNLARREKPNKNLAIEC